MPGQGRALPPPAAQRDESRGTVALPVFEFHSGFWLNLHHLLYQQARIREERLTRKPVQGVSELLPLSGFSDAEQQAWQASLGFYADTMAARDLLFDGDLVLIKNRLAEVENCPDLSGRADSRCKSGLRPELIAALERAAPVYRAKWWPEQDKRNRDWIAAITPRVQKEGVPLGTQLSNLFHTDWPTGRIRVEVSNYAGVLGSYTTIDPLTVTVSSQDERNAGAGAVEVLFYEASHLLGMGARDLIARECRARGKPIPRELWDAMLYYTAVTVSRGAYPRSGVDPGAAVTERGWRGYRIALDGFWKPFLQGALRNQANPEDLERAISRLVAAL